MNKRYQLIKPIISDKIYETSSLIKGAKKCYNEVKSAKIGGAKTFTVRDIDSQQTYIFKIHNPYIPANQLTLGGGGVVSLPMGNVVPLNNVVQRGGDDDTESQINAVKDDLKKLEDRVTALEAKGTVSGPAGTSDPNTCCIM